MIKLFLVISLFFLSGCKKGKTTVACTRPNKATLFYDGKQYSKYFTYLPNNAIRTSELFIETNDSKKSTIKTFEYNENDKLVKYFLKEKLLNDEFYEEDHSYEYLGDTIMLQKSLIKIYDAFKKENKFVYDETRLTFKGDTIIKKTTYFKRYTATEANGERKITDSATIKLVLNKEKKIKGMLQANTMGDYVIKTEFIYDENGNLIKIIDDEFKNEMGFKNGIKQVAYKKKNNAFFKIYSEINQTLYYFNFSKHIPLDIWADAKGYFPNVMEVDSLEWKFDCK